MACLMSSWTHFPHALPTNDILDTMCALHTFVQEKKSIPKIVRGIGCKERKNKKRKNLLHDVCCR